MLRLEPAPDEFALHPKWVSVTGTLTQIGSAIDVLEGTAPRHLMGLSEEQAFDGEGVRIDDLGAAAAAADAIDTDRPVVIVVAGAGVTALDDREGHGRRAAYELIGTVAPQNAVD